jgi:hypothetical protein
MLNELLKIVQDAHCFMEEAVSLAVVDAYLMMWLPIVLTSVSP